MARIKVHVPCLRPLSECDCPDDDGPDPEATPDDGGSEAGMIITAREALPGDVVLDSTQTEWKRGPDFHTWSTFAGPVMYEGPWLDSYGPQGELVLLVRDGKCVRS